MKFASNKTSNVASPPTPKRSESSLFRDLVLFTSELASDLKLSTKVASHPSNSLPSSISNRKSPSNIQSSDNDRRKAYKKLPTDSILTSFESDNEEDNSFLSVSSKDVNKHDDEYGGIPIVHDKKQLSPNMDLSDLDDILNTLDSPRSRAASRNSLHSQGHVSKDDEYVLTRSNSRRTMEALLTVKAPSSLPSSPFLRRNTVATPHHSHYTYRGSGSIDRELKCSSVYIGGASVSTGRSTFSQQRNNYPDTLQTKLLKVPGVSAYCCQCTWLSVDRLIRTSSDDNLHWVCSGHTS